MQSLGFRAWGLGFRVWGLGFRVWGLGFRLVYVCLRHEVLWGFSQGLALTWGSGSRAWAACGTLSSGV